MQRIPAKFSRLKGLGGPVSYHPLKYGFIKRAGSVVLGLIGFLGGTFTIGLALLQGFDRYYHHGPSVVLRGVLAPIILGVLLIAASFYVWVYAIRRWRNEAVLFEQGVAIDHPNGLMSCSWKELASFRMSITSRTVMGIPTGTDQKYLVIRTDGEQLRFDGELANAQALAEKIRAQVLPILFERFGPEFISGQEFVFGAVEIHKETGIRLKQKTLPWSALEKAAVQDGELHFSVSDPKGRKSIYRVSVAEIPNLDLLLTFIRQVKPAL